MAATMPTTFVSAAVERDAREPALADERDDVGHRRGVGQHDHVHQRHHHLADGGVAEVEDLVDHLGFLRAHRGLAGSSEQRLSSSRETNWRVSTRARRTAQHEADERVARATNGVKAARHPDERAIGLEDEAVAHSRATALGMISRRPASRV